MTDVPEIPEELLQQILGNPEVVGTLQTMAKQAGIETPVADMPREQQVTLVQQLIALSDSQMEQEVPDELVQQIFADPQADPILRDIMSANDLAGEPVDLPDDVKRAIVKMLIEQEVVSFEGPANDT